MGKHRHSSVRAQTYHVYGKYYANENHMPINGTHMNHTVDSTAHLQKRAFTASHNHMISTCVARYLRMNIN